MSWRRALPAGARGRIGRSMVYNLLGLGPPLLFAVAALPLLAAQLGAARFGVLLIGWTALGYLGLLNLGIGRALVHTTAGRDPRDSALAPLIWSALLLLLGVGTVGGALLYAAAPLLAGSVLGLDAALLADATAAFRLLALAVPFTVSAAALVAVLEARQRFGLLNVVAVPLAALNYFGPLAALAVADSLALVMAVLAAGRAAAWLVYLALAIRELPVLRARPRFLREGLRPLLGYGGWVTVSHVVSPLMTYADRFVVGALLSAAAVAWYATPQEIVIRFASLAGAVSAVLFPAFAAAATAERRQALLERGTAVVWVLVLPIAILLGAFGGEILRLWMGAEYATQGAVVLRWLALGLLANALARVYAAFLLGGGRPDLTGRLHLVELPLYAATLWLLVATFGIAGAAAAWFLRTAGDAAALLWLAVREQPGCAPAARRTGVLAAVGVACVLVPALAGPLAVRAALAAAALAGTGAFAWRILQRGTDEARGEVDIAPRGC